MVLRCTKRLLKRFGWEPEEEGPESRGRLGDWYANALNVGRERWVLCTSEISYLPVIVPQKRREFRRSFEETLDAVLDGLEISQELREQELETLHGFRIGTTQSRVVLGVMNDFTQMARHAMPGAHPVGVSLWLASSPSSPLGYESPDRRTRELFGLSRDWKNSAWKSLRIGPT